MAMKVSEIRLYPVKGLRGFSVSEAVVEPWGLEGDRRWMIVDGQGRFLTQREVPAMATIDAFLSDGGLRFAAAGHGEIEVATPDGAPSLEVTIWKDRLLATPADIRSSIWLSGVLGLPCQLVHMTDPAKARQVDLDYAQPGDHVSFADGYPVLITAAASLEALNGKLAEPVPMNRFRPNIVVSGAGAWEENTWGDVRVGAVEFRGVKPCARCVVTTVDQASGEKSEDGEPLRTLAKINRSKTGRIIFGENLVTAGVGVIAVGDTVIATTRR